MSKDSLARETILLKLLRGYPSAAGTVTRGLTEAYLAVVDEYSVEAFDLACKRFARGDVDGHNNAFPPSAAQLAAQTRFFAGILGRERARPKLVTYRFGELPPPGYEPLGPIKIDFGEGVINMESMTHAEKEEVIRNKGLPSSKTPLLEIVGKRTGE